MRPRVLVTRPAEDAAALSDALRERGCEPVELPLIGFEPSSDADVVASKVKALDADGWIAVTSPRASATLAAAGGAYGRGLVQVGPALPNAAGVAEELIRRGATSVLWLCGDRALPTLGARLAGAGVEVAKLVVYRTVLLCPGEAEMDDALLGLAAATFTSPSTVEALAACAKTPWLEAARASLRCVALGATTSSALSAAGFSRVVVAASPTHAALAAAASGDLGL